MSATDDTRPAAQYDPPPGLVALGTRVTVELVNRHGERETLTFDIVPDAAADLDAGFLAAGAPLGRAIMGRPSGSRVPYRLGDLVEVWIVQVTRSERAPDADAAESREAATRAAVDRAATEETIQLALTFSSKWGDYDPTPLTRGADEVET